MSRDSLTRTTYYPPKLAPFVPQEVIDSGKTNLHFVRVHAPWMVLCKYAEELNLRAPIQVRGRDKLSFLIKSFCFENEYD